MRLGDDGGGSVAVHTDGLLVIPFDVSLLEELFHDLHGPLVVQIPVFAGVSDVCCFYRRLQDYHFVIRVLE